MKTLARQLWHEPALFLAAVNAAVQSVQLFALDLPTGVNVAIAVLGAAAQALGTRSRVSPIVASVDR